ncbi:hypothetical protein ACM0O7_13195, partial [Enterococcus faecalis]|uniref:hypothetical protein n=1 Tax=Enterococcus faecalis TaxID=1351 RepID=UPI003A4C7D87
SSFLLLSFSIILPYLIVDLKLCNRTENKLERTRNEINQLHEIQAVQKKETANQNNVKPKL